MTIAVALSGCRAAPIPESQRFPAGTPLVPRYVTIDGTRIRYVDTGRGPAVVLIHGLAASLYSWRYTIVPLAHAGFRVIAFDNRGFGSSDKPAQGYSNAAYAALLFGLLDSLGVTDAVLVGHSMGGAIAAEAALTRPARARRLVLVNVAGLGVRWPFMLRVARWPIIGALADRFRGWGATAGILKSLYANPSRVTAGDVDQYYAPIAEPGFGRGLRGVFREFRFDALRGREPGLTMPTLVVWGVEDRLIPATIGQTLVVNLPQGAFVGIAAAGHAAPEEQPDLLNRTLIAYLTQGPPRVPENLALGSGPRN